MTTFSSSSLTQPDGEVKNECDFCGRPASGEREAGELLCHECKAEERRRLAKVRRRPNGLGPKDFLRHCKRCETETVHAFGVGCKLCMAELMEKARLRGPVCVRRRTGRPAAWEQHRRLA